MPSSPPKRAVAAGRAALSPDETADTCAGSAVAHPSQTGEGSADVTPVPADVEAAALDGMAAETSNIEESRGRQSTLTDDTASV